MSQINFQDTVQEGYYKNGQTEYRKFKIDTEMNGIISFDHWRAKKKRRLLPILLVEALTGKTH